VNLYSLDREKQLGKQLAQEVERSSRLIDDPVVTAYLDRIGQNIARHSDARIPIAIRVIDSDVINAFTLPGGFQYVNKGLILQTEGEAELAGVLARGIAHTAMRSSTMEASKGELMQLATIPPILLGPSGWAGYGNYQGLNLAIPVTYLKFRRDAEVAADFFGLQYLYEAGYDPECFSRFIERVWPQTSPGKNFRKVFSPFPPLPERLQNMKKEIATILPRRDGAIVSSSEFQEVKETGGPDDKS
jgi:predicted Zn-dependent protease